MTAWYNEHNPEAAEWLRELIKTGQIADGVVDERSILDVRADEISGFTQCHFFAGIGGWSYALRIAEWPDDRPVWTGSPPCQPFSTAGKGKGRQDERHLAPHFIDLVRTGRPRVLFGEQVASADVFGKVASKARKGPATPPAWTWLDDLSDRLEAAHYAVGASDIPAAGIAAPNIRQRTFFGANDLRPSNVRSPDTASFQRQSGPGFSDQSVGRGWTEPSNNISSGRMADRCRVGRCARREPDHGSNDGTEPNTTSTRGRLADFTGRGCGKLGCKMVARSIRYPHSRSDTSCWLADSRSRGRQARIPEPFNRQEGLAGEYDDCRGQPAGGEVPSSDPWPSSHNGFWGAADWLFSRDGKWRPVEPGTFPLAHGIPGRVGLLRGYGNAINPWAAAEFIEAFKEVI